MKVYIVQHSRVFFVQEESENLECEDTKFIGVYSSKQNAQKAVEMSCLLPGFKEYPDRFFVDEYEVDANHWDTGFITK